MLTEKMFLRNETGLIQDGAFKAGKCKSLKCSQ